jgi:asparagine synthase (glutamine-hydrolysing)
MRGHNIAIDAGTYLYSGEGSWRNGLAHTSVHNTVTVDDLDQMQMLTRFTWTDWSHGRVLSGNEKLWQGEHDGYKRLSDPVSHKRAVLSLDEDRWLVVDHLNAMKPHHYTLHWLLDDFPFEQDGQSLLLSADAIKHKVQFGLVQGNGAFSIVRADPISSRGWRSQYYAEKAPAISVMLEADQPRVIFWSFFGFDGDAVQQTGNTLKINSQEIDLSLLNK